MNQFRNDIIDEAIEKIRDCELVEPNVKRIRLYEAIGALLELKEAQDQPDEFEELRAKAAAFDWLNKLWHIRCDHRRDGQFDATFDDETFYIGEGGDLLEAVNNARGDK